MTSPAARAFTRDGRTMLITERGSVDGPTGRTFLLLHGIGMGHRYFRELADDLARSGRVLAVDLPGFGDAPEPSEPLDMTASGDFIADFIEAEGIERPVLVGHSMGSQVAVEALARHPQLFDRAVLIAPTVNATERTLWQQAARLAQDLAIEHPRVIGIGLVHYLKTGPRWYLKKLRTMLAHRVEESLPHIRASVLVVRGEVDYVCPRAWVQVVARTIPEARLVEIAGRGHETMVTDASVVSRHIVEHVSR
ncbi:alpha/beta fold hydrolase [Herbiconiux daphne]|uniref:Alpha/beta fold hydrolase n=1 Tax=Herbiconiux daphne TaxID=2970914 RepID=A0ABT2GY82_9MICO|nr:alpha/beta fold hydrolase [Herbiconiux daphne]MCS5732282.1 alpha/beta fold hydrolase [Herbiconiux daphne]